jgi:soluble lytic murein transglycosylase
LEVLDGTPQADQTCVVRYHLAESYSLARDYPAAAAAWESFLSACPGDSRLPQATLLLARARRAAGECSQAIVHYEDYLQQETVLADLVYEWIGGCRAANQEFVEAADAYGQALGIAVDSGAKIRLREKLAGAYLALRDYGAAVAQYDAILGLSSADATRARIEYLAGQALAASGQIEAAHARYRRAVDGYPEAEYAYLSLIELVEAGVTVDEFQRGLVDYYAGKTYPEAYEAAIRAFDRYLATESAAKADQALFRKALAQRSLDRYESALESLQKLISDYPGSQWSVRAQSEKGATLAAMGNIDAAVAAYRDLVALFPADARAPQALRQAAKLRERQGAHLQAAELYQEEQSRYPASEDADEALWRTGLALYRAGDVDRARSTWRSLLDNYQTSAYRTRTLYWLGKLNASMEPPAEEQDTWDQIVASSPYNYYALRVQQIRSGDSLTVTRLITAEIEPPAWDVAEAERDILTWLARWTQVPTDTTLLLKDSDVATRPNLRRGHALLAVGLRREALDAFDKARAAAWSDPQRLAQLALFFREKGFHGLAARCALRLVTLWPGGAILDAPPTLQRLAYPLAFVDLISSEARTRNLDPLLLAALIRQESLFEPVATSWVGARGLGQVMPATGEGIARSLNMHDFILDDLYRPSVSVRFGAYYLAVQMKRFGGQFLVALAAYNGGPGNALRWVEAGGDDLDLFVEVISLSESQRYLQRVYEQYLIYEALYRTGRAGRQ